jgi:predicted DsbA family dithiol-disulfide isomerase
MSAVVDVVEYTDPGCIWSWSSEPALRALRARYGAALRWRRVFGIQIDGPRTPAPAHDVRAGWLDVAAHTGAPIAERLVRVHASSLPMSRAARAAEQQGRAVAERVLRRLREAVFVDGRAPDTPAGIAAALRGVAGLDGGRLLDDLDGEAVVWSVDADRAEARRPHPAVVSLAGGARHPALGGLRADGPNPGLPRQAGDGVRYGFPTLLLRGPAGERVVPGWREPGDYLAAVVAVAPALAGVRRPVLDPDEALERYGTLTARELELLAGGAEPRRAVRAETATTPLWLHPDEARRREPAAVGAA